MRGGAEAESLAIRALATRMLLVPVVAAGALGLFVGIFWLASDSPDFHGHALFHWAVAIPVVLGALAIVRLPEARTRPRRIARLFVAVLVIVLAASQLLEGIGAFASARGLGKTLEPIHVVGEGGTLLSVFTLPLALAFAVVVYALAGVNALRRR